MTVNELIAKLSALSPEERELPVLSAFYSEHERRIKHDPKVDLSVDDVRTDTLIGFHTFHDQTTVRALRIL